MSKRDYVQKYEGGNAHLDKLLAMFPDDEVWIVNGSSGRKPVVATSEQDARDKYEATAEVNRYTHTERGSMKRGAA